MSGMRENGPTQLLESIGTTNPDHFYSFISQGGNPERYGEWLKVRYDFDENQRVILDTGSKRRRRRQVIQRVTSIDQETSSSEDGTKTNNA